MNLYTDLIDSTEDKCQRVTISSMPPRLPDESQEKIDSINAGLLAACHERENVNFIDTTPIFKLADGSLNDGYLRGDGTSITKPAMNKLAKKLNLRIKNKEQGVCLVEKEQHKTRAIQVKRSSRSSQQQQEAPRQQVRISTLPKIRISSQDSWCANCGEGNHVQRNCRYTEPLECHQCYNKGHKSKFCELYVK